MSRIDRKRVRDTFDRYVSHYNAGDPKIALKIFHTYRVAQLCEEIGSTLELTQEENDVLWTCGMLHDIGRFEQVTRYGTFIDTKSVDHALLGYDILFGKNEAGMMREFVAEDCFDEAIGKAIRWHSAYRITEDMTAWEKTCANVLRDADKIDIYRVNMETPMEEIYNVTTQQLKNCSVTPEVMNAFHEHHTVLRDLKKTPIDHLVGHICLAFELVFPKSRSIVLEQGYLMRMMDFHSEDEKANEQMAYIKKHMREWLEIQ